MYDGIKKAHWSNPEQDGPLKSSSGEIITDKGLQMERWVEHYSDDCNNYRGISLVSIVGKVFARVILITLPEAGVSYLPGITMWLPSLTVSNRLVFSLRQLQEKCREQQVPLYIAFIDLTEAFDLVSSERFFQRLVAHPNCRTSSSICTLTRKEQCSWTTAPQSQSKSTVASNKAASLLEHSLGFALPSCKNMTSAQQQTESTFKFHEETCAIENRFQSGNVEKRSLHAFKQRAFPPCSSRVIYPVRQLQRSGQ